MLNKQTLEELILEKALIDEGLDVIPQYKDETHKVVDLRVRKAKVDIEVDGLHHLLNPIQINRDLDRSYHSQQDGYATLHVPNMAIHMHLKRVAHSIAQALKFRMNRIKFGGKSRLNKTTSNL